MTMLSKPSAEKTRALREAVATYQDHIGNEEGAAFVRAQPDDFTQWSGYAHQLVTMMDKKTFQKDLPPNIEGMMDFSKEKTAELTARTRGLANLAQATVSKSKDKWGGRRQSENVIDRRDKGQLPVEPSLLAQALAGAQEIGERGQRGFGKIIAALMGESESAAPSQPRSEEDAARAIRAAYGPESWGAPSPQTIDKHAWDAAGNPSFGGVWYDRGEQMMRDAWLEANRKDQSTVGGDTGGFDPAHFPGGYPPIGDDPNDFDGDGVPDLLKGGASFATGGRNSRMLGKNGLWGKETKQLGVPATPGAAVTSPVSGTVVYAGNFRSYGYVVMVRAEDGSIVDISGMTTGTVKPGDQVQAGQTLGVAGEQTNIGIKGANGKWGDPTSLAEGLQSAGTAPVAGYDGGDDSYGVGSAGMAEPQGTSSGLVGGPTNAGYADAGLRGAPMMPGVAPTSKTAEIAKALSAPSMDSSLMGGALAPAPKAAPDAVTVDLVDAPTAPPAPNYGLDEAFTDAWSGLKDAFGATSTAQTPDALDVTVNEGNLGLDGLAAVGSITNRGLQADKMSMIAGDLMGEASNPSTSPTLVGPTSDWASPGLNAFGAFGSETNYGTPSTALADVDPMTAFTRSMDVAPAMTAFGSPISAKTPAAVNAFGQFSGTPSYGDAQSSSDMSAAAQFGAPFGGFTGDAAAPSMVAGDPMGDMMGAYGSFGGIGSPTADQAAIGQKGLAAAASPFGKANAVTSIAKALGPLDAFHDAFEGSVKSVGQKAKAAFRDAYADPKSVAKSLAAIEATRAYTSMNGLRNNPEVLGLRSQQIANYGMASPAIGNALGLSMGQGGQSAIGGGLGGDPFGGGGFGGPSGPSGGSGGGFGGPGGQPSGPSFGGPSGPSGGAGGGYGGGTSGGQPSGPSIGGPSGPGAGPGGGYGGGNPAGSPSPGGVTTGRGPSSNPGQGGGLSAAAASAIGAALSHEAAAAAASDAARGFGGYGMGPSFSGGFF